MELSPLPSLLPSFLPPFLPPSWIPSLPPPPSLPCLSPSLQSTRSYFERSFGVAELSSDAVRPCREFATSGCGCASARRPSGSPLLWYDVRVWTRALAGHTESCHCPKGPPWVELLKQRPSVWKCLAQRLAHVRPSTTPRRHLLTWGPSSQLWDLPGTHLSTRPCPPGQALSTEKGRAKHDRWAGSRRARMPPGSSSPDLPRERALCVAC